MPKGYGTGPISGRGGRGHGMGHGRPSTCVCPSCGHKSPHSRGFPCRQAKCPECGAVMARA